MIILETMPEGRHKKALAIEVEGMLREDFISSILAAFSDLSQVFFELRGRKQPTHRQVPPSAHQRCYIL